jgi:hypothetical protein
MKRQVRIAVIVPAGPRDDVLDTLASVVHYTEPSRIIVVVDDTSNLDRSVAGSQISGQKPRSYLLHRGLWVVRVVCGSSWQQAIAGSSRDTNREWSCVWTPTLS